MDNISIENFRVFKKLTKFKLSPITILTGKNNSGKSSLLKSLLILSDYLQQGANQTYLGFNGLFSNKHKIDQFKNAKNWTHSNKTIYFSYTNEDLQFEFSFSGQDEEENAFLDKFSVKSLSLASKLELKRLSENTFGLTVPQLLFDYIARPEVITLFKEDNLLTQIDETKAQIKNLNKEKRRGNHTKGDMINIISEIQQLKTRQKLMTKEAKDRIVDSLQSNIYEGMIDIREVETRSDFLTLSISSIIRAGLSKYFDTKRADKNDIQFKALLRFTDLLNKRMQIKLSHLGPNRTFQARLYFRQNNTSEINEVLFTYANNKPKEGTKADMFLKKWLKLFMIGDNIKVDIIEGTACRVEIIKNGYPNINLADLGFGPGQLLTILLSLTQIINERQGIFKLILNINKAKPLILIEEPEANLHPSLQSLLAVMLLELNHEFKINCIVETHSEYLIRKTQVLVKEIGKDHPFKVYYFDSEKGIYEMKYREDGKFIEEFGSGFFDESRKLAFEIL